MVGVVAKKARKMKTMPYDVADYLRTPEEMAAYLDAWLEEAHDDTAGVAQALESIARAKRTTQVTKDVGLSHESLHRALSVKGSPSFAAFLKAIKSLGLKLRIEAA